MQLLNRYLLAQYFRYFFTLNIGFTSLYLLIDFFEKFDEFAEAGKPMSLVIKFFLLNIPFVVDQISPILILLSGVITFGLLNHNNELTALKAAGIPLKKIVKPILIGALLATSLFIAAAQLLLPYTMSTTNDIWHKQVRGKVPLGIFRNGRYYFRGNEGFYSFQWANSEKLVFTNFSYSTWNDAYNVRSVTVAAYADWAHPYWVLKHGQIIDQGKDGAFVATPFEIKVLNFPESPADFLVPEYEAAEQSLTGLFNEIRTKQSESQRVTALAEFYARVSYLLLGIPLLLLGLPILIISFKKWGRDLSIAIPVSCFMAFVAWGIWGALQSFAKSGYIPSLPAAVTVHVIFSAIGLYLLRNQER